jgi:putative redox protein
MMKVGIMSVEIDITYAGQLHCEAVHRPSGARLATDAPVDNHGRGENFSPTDLVAAALGTCVMTVMGIVAERHELDLTGTRVHVIKEMIQQPVRRIGHLGVTITVPADKAARLSESDRSKLESAAKHCPVHQSLHPDVRTTIDVVYAAP